MKFWSIEWMERDDYTPGWAVARIHVLHAVGDFFLVAVLDWDLESNRY